MWNKIDAVGPGYPCYCLIYVGGNYNRIYVAWWDMTRHVFLMGASPVTHWMPLPAPPTAADSGAGANSTQQAQPKMPLDAVEVNL